MIQLSQSKIAIWQTCERKFQLRYVEKNEWPIEPFAEESTKAMEAGEIFHMLAAQKILLGSQFEAPLNRLEAPLDSWWGNFENSVAKLMPRPSKSFRVETSLAAQVNSQVKLFGRIDLLVAEDYTLEIFDWKTGRPRSQPDLEQDWQTRIYMALLYQSRQALCGSNISAEQLSMTYWYAQDPERSVKIRFDEAWHVQNWVELVGLAGKISDRASSSATIWPLTNDLNACGRCSFNALCGREPAPKETLSSRLTADQNSEIDSEELSGLILADRDVHPDI